ncbi:hypothetical protein FB451DRAFT_1266556 [Mycena latifolia]|nr:hypothetical protein FB451DRAFT_1266556 [Mycena latifolia]
MLQGLYTGIALVGAVLIPVGVAQDPKHVACPPTDLQSQDTTQNPDGLLTVTCHYAGGLDCHYLSGVGTDSDHACPNDLIDANGHTTINLDAPKSTPPPNPSPTSQNVPATTTDLTSTVQLTPLPTSASSNTASSSPTTTSTSTAAVPTSTGPNAGGGGGSSSASSDIVTLSLASTTPAGSTSIGGQSAQSLGAARKSSISGAMMVGIAVGVVVLLVFAGLYTHRRCRRTRTSVEAWVDLESARGEDPPAGVADKREWMTHQEFSERQQTQELRVAGSESTTSLPTAGIRQQYLRNKILAMQMILHALPSSAHISTPLNNSTGPHSNGDGTLEQATHQNAILEMRIRKLESQLESQWALGFSDEAPPGYLE